MDDFRISIAASAQREFDEDIPFPAKRQLNHKVVALKRNPRPRTSVRDPVSGYYAIESGGWAVEYSVDDAARIVYVLRFIRISRVRTDRG